MLIAIALLLICTTNYFLYCFSPTEPAAVTPGRPESILAHAVGSIRLRRLGEIDLCRIVDSMLATVGAEAFVDQSRRLSNRLFVTSEIRVKAR
ncbi:hypothetical protein [Paraburkholderia tagetis]|uniref:Uncharacterized protein n=1 Tax=Paraburkholderia tagetis TaxID=2913261 RepID=A0A9X1UMK5_9BURK|nr:hypothetical protein [Paraburkholderia tagetis]MCG5078176.1 hypothetical protein [Paraburkholderia tagetis]